MRLSETPQRQRTGRPRSFDRDAALQQAMVLFWQTGYETTSIAELTAAMGITAPSLYAAFGDKRQLFLEAMRRYAGDPVELERSLATANTARDAMHTLLMNAAMAFTDDASPKGCLLASATASGSEASADVRQAVSEVRRTVVGRLVQRIDQDVTAGMLPASTNATALADLILAIIQGMSVLARDGVPRERLVALADHALTTWPTEAG